MSLLLVPFTLGLNGIVSSSWFLKTTQADARLQILCLLSYQISHQTLRVKKEVIGAELHTQGGLHRSPENAFRERRRGVA